MSSYIHFTEEQKQRAAAVNLEEFLRCRGEKLLSSGREKRLASDHSVTVRGNEWYITEWDESAVRQLVETVKILSKDEVAVTLKGGIEICQKIMY